MMKRHPLDLFSLLSGSLLVAVAILSLTTGLDTDLVTSDVFWPLVLIGLGLVALAATLGSHQRNGDDAPIEGVAPLHEDAADVDEHTWPAGDADEDDDPVES